MKLKVERDKLAAVVRLLSCVVDEAKLDFTPDGLEVRIVDDAHVCMVKATVPKSAFLSYSVLGNEEVGVDLEKLAGLLALTSAKEILLETTETKLQAIVGQTTRNMKLIDTTSMAHPKVPTVSLPESADIPLEELQTAVKACVSVADCISVRTEPPDFLFSAQGDTDDVDHRIPGVGTKTKVKSLFPIEYLHAFAAKVPTDAKLRIHVGADYPLQVDVSWGEGANAASATYLLAPRIEDSG